MGRQTLGLSLCSAPRRYRRRATGRGRALSTHPELRDRHHRPPIREFSRKVRPRVATADPDVRRAGRQPVLMRAFRITASGNRGKRSPSRRSAMRGWRLLSDQQLGCADQVARARTSLEALWPAGAFPTPLRLIPPAAPKPPPRPAAYRVPHRCSGESLAWTDGRSQCFRGSGEGTASLLDPLSVGFLCGAMPDRRAAPPWSIPARPLVR